MATIVHLVFLVAEGLIYLIAGLYAVSSEHHHDMCVYYWLIAGTLGLHALAAAICEYRKQTKKSPVSE